MVVTGEEERSGQIPDTIWLWYRRELEGSKVAPRF